MKRRAQVTITVLKPVLFDLLSRELVTEILSYLDARNVGKVSRLGRICADAVADAVNERAQRLDLQLPAPIAGESAARRLRFSERVGLTGIELSPGPIAPRVNSESAPRVLR